MLTGIIFGAPAQPFRHRIINKTIPLIGAHIGDHGGNIFAYKAKRVFVPIDTAHAF